MSQDLSRRTFLAQSTIVACVGMFDFHAVENAIIATRVVAQCTKRDRPCCA